MPRRAIGLVGSEATFVQNALKLIPKDPKDTLAYVAIHGDKSVFKIVEDNIWKTITHRSLAKWIAETPAYNGKTIVLLSCSNLASAEKLSSSLTALDQKAGKPLHRIIAWEGKVDLFANGRINGLGACKIYQSGKSSVVLNAPKGTNAEATGKKLRLGVIDIASEEGAGGHSIARHGAHLSMVDMEERVLGTHSSLGQSRSALKFLSQSIQEDAINAAYTAYRGDIEAHFRTNGGNESWELDLGSPIGEGFRNSATLSAPTSVQVSTTRVKVVFKADPNHPRGFFLLTAYPVY
jgi:Bacterial CdiA-CT RNAse A domain